MERYDYKEAVSDDIRDYIKEYYTVEELKEKFEDKQDFENELYDILFCEDCVTRNASGSYYCNAWKSEEALSHNLDLLADALEEFGGDLNPLKDGAEACDVTIRCYMLGQCIGDVLEEFEDDIQELIDLDEDIEDMKSDLEFTDDDYVTSDDFGEEEVKSLISKYGYGSIENEYEEYKTKAIDEFEQWCVDYKKERENEREI